MRDIALFIKNESTITSKYQYGIVHYVLPNRDVIIRKAVVKCRNDQENLDSFTIHAVRELVRIHPIDEINLMEELGNMVTVAYKKQNLYNKH